MPMLADCGLRAILAIMTRTWTRRQVMVLTMLLLGAARAGGGHPNATLDAAIQAVLALFDRTPLVALGEVHAVTEIHAFLRALITTPAFGARVHTIVVEFGTARLQAVADDFILDRRDVSPIELRSVWQDTTQVTGVWDAPVYGSFFRAVRDANRVRPAGQPPIRVILGDPPIDWDRVQTLPDMLAFSDRDGFFAQQVEAQVLARSQRALLVTGLSHALRTSLPGLGASGAAIDRIVARHPRSVTVVMPYLGFPDELQAQRERLLAGGNPRLVLTKDSWLGALPAGKVLNGPPQAPLGLGEVAGQPPLAQVVDALLVLGNPAQFTMSVPSPALYQDPVYRAELVRRQRLFGIDPRIGLAALDRPQQRTYYR
jgi:hypothetical protein